MRWSLHPVILGQRLSLSQQLAIAAEAGYDGLDVDAVSLQALVEKQGLEATRANFAAAGVAPAAWGLPTDWRGEEASFKASLAQLPEQAKVMVELGCPRCFTYLLPSTTGDPAEYRRFLKQRLGAVGEVLADYGVRLGLEWLGPLHLRARGTPVIWKMSHTLQLIDDLGLPNLGLLLDVWHWFTAEDTVEKLRALPAERIVHCHFNDAPNKPLAEQIDSQREVPGRGIIPLRAFLQALRDIGYQDFLAVEIFNQGLKSMPPLEAARLVKQACDALLAQLDSPHC
jgi:sugar phosphate isomerase/epimerase